MPMPYGFTSVANTATTQIPTRRAHVVQSTDALKSPPVAHNPRVPAPTIQPPWKLTQVAMSSGTTLSFHRQPRSTSMRM